jgi:excisionase family DNA binding protein
MSQSQDFEKLALSIPEFCTAVGIGRSRTYEEIKAGRLRILKCGRRTLIAREAVTEWLGQLSGTSNTPAVSAAAGSDV